jgi:micrococcal nuclease
MAALAVAAVGFLITNLSSLEDVPAPSPSPTPTLRGVVQGEQGIVQRIVDGDTVRVLVGDESVSVRLIGINTPESVDPRREVECFGKESAAAMTSLVAGKIVHLKTDDSQLDRDRYGRWLRYIYLEDGTFVNQKLVEDGYAAEYTYDRPYIFQQEFKQAEAKARTERRGLWQACASTVPAYGEQEPASGQ